jgi:nitroimidazol reductase NimA-like FMN-containing flavoprotein (pyridoxamine 5'-phosphate oxidase superfamily)
VVGTGVARVVSDPAEKLRGLEAIMRHYGEGRPVYRPETLARTCVIAIAVQSMRGKRLG